MSFVVLKFGGTSVSSLSRWRTIARQIVSNEVEGHHVVVVCSALSGVTDQLTALLDVASGDPGRDGHSEKLLDALCERHRAFCTELSVEPEVISEELDELRRLVAGARLLGEVSPRSKARVLAKGELMLTRIGAQWLRKEGIDATWMDARSMLSAIGDSNESRRFLSAEIDTRPDAELVSRLMSHRIVLTQGFIASETSGATVLLGRGGSDTSAAILAAKLSATRCEIWTDVPGMFTADPRKLPAARLLRALDYAEAQEIATTGAKVLHPRAIAPVRSARIPLVIRNTPQPEVEGTRISAQSQGGAAQVKALSSRKGLVLVSMDTLGMWQQVGFLADAFTVFKSLGLSVDVISTSETEVTATLDPAANTLDEVTLERLLVLLSPICSARIVTGCASVSLVGRGIRGILHRLAPVLELFEEQRVHLVSQAASDLNLTFVVDEGQVDRLVAKLHALLFAHRAPDELLGPSWQELFGADRAAQRPHVAPAAPWWESRRAELLSLAKSGTPTYVIDGPTVAARARELVSMSSVSSVLYAMKANPHPPLLEHIAGLGLGFETVSEGELSLARAARGDRSTPLLFTPNFAPRVEYARALQQGVQLTLDNLHPLMHWPELFAGRDLFVRIDPGQGRGHHAHVRTAGPRSKFGIAPDEIERLLALVRPLGARIVGLHAHVGSGVLEPSAWQETALSLLSVAEALPDVAVLDLGGGLGVSERHGRPGLDLSALDDSLARVRAAHPHYALWLEPGRYLVAEAGALVCTVTQIKRKGELVYIGADAGMHTLLRPALYGAYHPIYNLTRLGEAAEITATVVGPICETGDVLGRDRLLPETKEGDVLLIATAGAYGAAMASGYNSREMPRQVLLP